MTTWFVRPGPGPYGAGDGSSYDDAWAGFASVNYGSIVPGDTLALSGVFSEWFQPGVSGTATDQVIIDGNAPALPPGAPPGSIENFDNWSALNINSRTNLIIRNLAVRNCTGHAFRLEGASSNIVFERCISENNNAGFYLFGSTDGSTWLEDIKYLDCTAIGNRTNGFYAVRATRNIDYYRCTSLNNSPTVAAKGFTTTSLASSNNTWTLVSGTTYKGPDGAVTTTPVGVYDSVNRRYLSAGTNSASLTDGQYVIEANTLYVNFGSATTGWVYYTAVQPSNLRYYDCVADNNVELSNVRGDGFDIGNLAILVNYYRCKARVNQGSGFTTGYGVVPTTLDSCTAETNSRNGILYNKAAATIRSSSVVGNMEDGISLPTLGEPTAVVQRCVVNNNQQIGITGGSSAGGWDISQNSASGNVSQDFNLLGGVAHTNPQPAIVLNATGALGASGRPAAPVTVASWWTSSSDTPTDADGKAYMTPPCIGAYEHRPDNQYAAPVAAQPARLLTGADIVKALTV